MIQLHRRCPVADCDHLVVESMSDTEAYCQACGAESEVRDDDRELDLDLILRGDAKMREERTIADVNNARTAWALTATENDHVYLGREFNTNTKLYHWVLFVDKEYDGIERTMDLGANRYPAWDTRPQAAEVVDAMIKRTSLAVQEMRDDSLGVLWHVGMMACFVKDGKSYSSEIIEISKDGSSATLIPLGSKKIIVPISFLTLDPWLTHNVRSLAPVAERNLLSDAKVAEVEAMFAAGVKSTREWRDEEFFDDCGVVAGRAYYPTTKPVLKIKHHYHDRTVIVSGKGSYMSDPRFKEVEVAKMIVDAILDTIVPFKKLDP